MSARTTMIKVGVWDVLANGIHYRYRVVIAGKNKDWVIYKQKKELVLCHTEYSNPNGAKWEEVESGFKSKISAVEYVEELAVKENFNPVADHLNNHG